MTICVIEKRGNDKYVFVVERSKKEKKCLLCKKTIRANQMRLRINTMIGHVWCVESVLEDLLRITKNWTKRAMRESLRDVVEAV